MLSAPIAETAKQAADNGAVVPEHPSAALQPRSAAGVGNQAMLRRLLQRKCDCGGSETGCADCGEKEERLSRKRGSDAEPRGVPPVVHDVLRSPGQPLDRASRTFMEARFGRPFADVRVHTGARASESARAVNALAYTVGNDIVFRTGSYAPQSSEGRTLLAHELTHVVQQTSGGAAAGVQGKLTVGRADDAAEREADQVAAQIDRLAPVDAGQHGSGSPAPLVQRRSDPGVGGGTLPYREAKDLTDCVRIMGRANEDYCRQEVLGEKPVPRAPACNNPQKRLSVCVRPVRIAEDDGTKPTTLPSFADADDIWAKCCIDLLVGTAKTVNKTAYKVLDESPNDTPSAEETSLFTDAGASGGCISVFVADTFRQAGTTSKDISGGGGTYDAGKAEPKIVVVEGVHPTIVAHEIGHALSYAPHSPAGTVMEVTANRHDQKESNKVAKVICDQVKNFTSGTAVGKSDCCTDVS